MIYFAGPFGDCVVDDIHHFRPVEGYFCWVVLDPMVIFVRMYSRWAPGSYKWSYNPYKWHYKWPTVLITVVVGIISTQLQLDPGAHRVETRCTKKKRLRNVRCGSFRNRNPSIPEVAWSPTTNRTTPMGRPESHTFPPKKGGTFSENLPGYRKNI